MCEEGGRGSCGVGDGTRRSSLPESGGQGGRTGSRLSFKDTLPMGEEEEVLSSAFPLAKPPVSSELGENNSK